MTFREIDKILRKNGWYLKNVKGSHHQYVKQGQKGKVTVPCHGGDLDPKTVKSIMKQAGLD